MQGFRTAKAATIHDSHHLNLTEATHDHFDNVNALKASCHSAMRPMTSCHEHIIMFCYMCAAQDVQAVDG
jgi:hypothetical protein